MIVSAENLIKTSEIIFINMFYLIHCIPNIISICNHFKLIYFIFFFFIVFNIQCILYIYISTLFILFCFYVLCNLTSRVNTTSDSTILDLQFIMCMEIIIFLKYDNIFHCVKPIKDFPILRGKKKSRNSELQLPRHRIM